MNNPYKSDKEIEEELKVVDRFCMCGRTPSNGLNNGCGGQCVVYYNFGIKQAIALLHSDRECYKQEINDKIKYHFNGYAGKLRFTQGELFSLLNEEVTK